jgi:hypothetical protein
MGEEETGEIAFDAAWQDVVDELEKLSAVGPGNVTASGGPLPAPVLLSFTGDLAGRAVEPATADSTGLSADEGKARADVYRVPQADVSLSGLSPATGDVNVRLSLAGEETAAFDASATSGAAAALLLCGLDGAGPYRVTGTGPAGGPWTFRFWHGLGGPDADAPELEVLPQDTTPPSGPPAASQIEATADIGDSRGYALEASGTMRLSFGAQYRLDPPATGTGTFTVRVNGTTVLTATAGAPLLPAVHTLAVPLSSGTGGGRMAAWGRPGSRSGELMAHVEQCGRDAKFPREWHEWNKGECNVAGGWVRDFEGQAAKAFAERAERNGRPVTEEQMGELAAKLGEAQVHMSEAFKRAGLPANVKTLDDLNQGQFSAVLAALRQAHPLA